MPDGQSGRRAYDRAVDPAIEVFVEERVTATRHLLRNEFTVALSGLTRQLTELQASTVAGNLKATEEHAEVNAGLRELRDDIAELKPLPERVTKLEGVDRTDHAVAKALREFKQGIDRKFYAFGGLVVAAVGVLAAVLHH